MGKLFVGITFLFVLQIFLVGLVVGALARLFISGIFGLEGPLAATLQIGAAAGIILYLERR